MPTAAKPPVEAHRDDPSVSPDSIFRLSVKQYHEMIRARILTADDRVELLDGLLVPKMSKNPPHRVATELVADALRSIMPAGWYVTTQEPVTTSTSEPEPDVSVVRGRPRDYLQSHPGPENIAMVVEIADSSINRDRGAKRRAYARAGVVVYWIVDVLQRRIEIFTSPTGPAENPEYHSIQYYGEDETAPLVIGANEVGRIAVRDVLP